MNDRSKLFQEFYETHLSLQNYHTRNSGSTPPVRLDVERNFAIFQTKKSVIRTCMLTHSMN